MKTRKYEDYIRSFINISKECGFNSIGYRILERFKGKIFGCFKKNKYIVTLKHSKSNKKIDFHIDFIMWKETNLNYHNKNYWQVDIYPEDSFFCIPFMYGESPNLYDIKEMIEECKGRKELKNWLLKIEERVLKYDED